MARAFTLIELIIVVAVIGIAAAVAVPNIVAMAGRAEGDKAVREAASAVAAARDGARGSGVCLDYVQRPPPPSPGPYQIDIFRVACPNEPAFLSPILIGSRPLSPRITLARASQTLGGSTTVTDRVHFSRDGSIINPSATVCVEAVVDGVDRKFHIYPAAGTIEMVEAP
ncbi:MAG: prepilin-type N-terminal cleavage/methylation domain-containing protein [Deltaproteobacteria bacterium]|nr:prepilin-type N-terminal cleavage/methylation domain-containing protein [Deltaproteobacteria bacterium]